MTASRAPRTGRLARWGRVLFALEARPPYLRLAVRGTLGLAVPLSLGWTLAWPSFNAVAVKRRSMHCVTSPVRVRLSYATAKECVSQPARSFQEI